MEDDAFELLKPEQREKLRLETRHGQLRRKLIFSGIFFIFFAITSLISLASQNPITIIAPLFFGIFWLDADISYEIHRGNIHLADVIRDNFKIKNKKK